MRVRDKDVPNMTSEWKSAIRAKRKATSKHKKSAEIQLSVHGTVVKDQKQVAAEVMVDYFATI